MSGVRVWSNGPARLSGHRSTVNTINEIPVDDATGARVRVGESPPSLLQGSMRTCPLDQTQSKPLLSASSCRGHRRRTAESFSDRRDRPFNLQHTGKRPARHAPSRSAAYAADVHAVYGHSDGATRASCCMYPDRLLRIACLSSSLGGIPGLMRLFGGVHTGASRPATCRAVNALRSLVAGDVLRSAITTVRLRSRSSCAVASWPVRSRACSAQLALNSEVVHVIQDNPGLRPRAVRRHLSCQGFPLVAIP